MSGLSHTPGKRAKGQTFRGFESRPLRQPQTKKRLHGAFLFLALAHRLVRENLANTRWSSKSLLHSCYASRLPVFR